MSKIDVAIIGASGYTGGELMRILSRHKKVEITTKITFTYEDGSTRTVNQVQVHEFK